jgi:hypothetical protein
MHHVRLYDACFPNTPALTAAEGTAAVPPRTVQWERGGYQPVAVYTDSCLHLAAETEHPRKIAWLIEPPPFRQGNYDFVQANGALFDYVLTYNARLVDGRKFLFYPFGGTRIAPNEWGITPKERLCNIVVSAKRETEGHQLRHAVVDMVRAAGLPVDVLGTGYAPWQPKRDLLAPYYYSIVIENECLNWWFTEKLLDCFAVGTVPLYWGCPHITTFFNRDALPQWYDLPELRALLAQLTPAWWETRLPALHGNLERAQEFLCAEDWIVDHYPWLFEV